MAGNDKKLAPEVIDRVKKDGAAAKENVLRKTVLVALLSARPEDLMAPDSDAEIIKGNARRSGCWVRTPAIVEFFAAADRRLTRVASWAGMNVKRVEKVHASLLKGTRLVIIKAASPEDLTALPVTRNRTTTVNLISLLGAHGLTVATGHRERFDVAYVPEESPLWPALVIDLGQVKERRLEPSARKDGAQPAALLIMNWSGGPAQKPPRSLFRRGVWTQTGPGLPVNKRSECGLVIIPTRDGNPEWEQ